MRIITFILAIVLVNVCVADETIICGYTVRYTLHKTQDGRRPYVSSIKPTDEAQAVFLWPSYLGGYPANQWWSAHGIVGENFINCYKIEEFQIAQPDEIWVNDGCLIGYDSNLHSSIRLLAYPPAKKTAFVPDGVDTIMKSFSSTNLEEIVLPESIRAFYVGDLKSLCPQLKRIWCLGNAPGITGTDFSDIEDLKIYAEGGTTDWPDTDPSSAWAQYTVIKPTKTITNLLVVEEETCATNISNFCVKYDGAYHQPKLKVLNLDGGIVRYSFSETGPFEFTPPSVLNCK